MKIIDEEKARDWLTQRAQEHQDRNEWDASFEDLYLVTALFRGDFLTALPEDPAAVQDLMCQQRIKELEEALASALSALLVLGAEKEIKKLQDLVRGLPPQFREMGGERNG